ncbi:MAG: thioredoxin domain-containing protein [Gemmatimonadales bacterium]
MPNRLSTARSAYLTSAAHQPVHWHPWGPEAFAAARSTGRPILLDIGAVWCHWCHVMDGESYEDPALAGLLNTEFVCIKVDRDERPDIDARYQRAVQALTGQGGWPLTAFLTAQGEVFYGGTYFPPEGLHGRPGFRSVLTEVARIHREEQGRVEAQALAIKRALAHAEDPAGPIDPTNGLLDTAEAELARHFDARHGGFGRAPKFPHPAAISFLIDRWYDSGRSDPGAMARDTLRGMARGGFHDQVGGGFHRYSVDPEWIVPHFEKMAYDNAELLKAYLDGHAAFDDPYFGDVARDTLAWIREVLADPDGGFGTSQDADVGLEDDGNYFTWTIDEARAALTADEFEVVAAHYDIGTAGEMHHDPARNVLWIAEDTLAIAHRTGRPAPVVADLLSRGRTKLAAARRLRPAPFIDRTRYTGWNAMLASALLSAAAHLDDPWARTHALRTLERIGQESPDPDAVLHVTGGISGLLDDQVQVAAAALDAYETTGTEHWLAWAEAIMDRVWRDYRDEAAGGLFDIAHARGGEGLLPERTKPIQDSPTPSPNGVAALTYARLAALTGRAHWQTRHLELVRTFGGQAAGLGLFGATFLRALEWSLLPMTHLVVVGPKGHAESDRMHRWALTTFIPRKVVHRLTSIAGVRPLPPALQAMVNGTTPRAYACRGETCQAPAGDDATWAATLAALRPVH